MRFGILDRYFPDTGHAWRASHAELAAAGLDARTATEVVRAQQEIDPNAEMERLEQAGVTALAIGAPGDPSRLRSMTPRRSSTCAASGGPRKALMRALTREPQHIDVAARKSGLALSVASGTLALLELKGLVRDLGGMQFVRVREDTADYGPDEATPTSAARANGTPA